MEISTVLFQQAKKIQRLAYAPYSKFKVGVALQSKDGTQCVGCNIENASYGLTLCAEASAIAHMVALGKHSIQHLVIVADQANCPPCGACRQRIAEFADPALRIYLSNDSGITQTLSLQDLLPNPFGLTH